MRIFLDANIIIAACGSEQGGSRALFEIAKKDSFLQLITSDYALREAKRNITEKLPVSIIVFTALTKGYQLMTVREAPPLLTQNIVSIVPKKDAPILSAALFARAEYLCTLDKKDFHSPATRQACSALGVTIATPGDILLVWDKKITGATKKI
jgi:predicted nucleic acid-binding protein